MTIWNVRNKNIVLLPIFILELVSYNVFKSCIAFIYILQYLSVVIFNLLTLIPVIEKPVMGFILTVIIVCVTTLNWVRPSKFRIIVLRIALILNWWSLRVPGLSLVFLYWNELNFSTFACYNKFLLMLFCKLDNLTIGLLVNFF